MIRHAGILMPLFSAASSSGWGIGEFGDVATLAQWLSSAGFDRLMLLPLGAMAAGQSSPYSAMSAMAIDPIYIGLGRLEDFAHLGGTAALGTDARMNLESARARVSVDYANVRRAKHEALRLSFDRFITDEWRAGTPRASALFKYVMRERSWLIDYALYCAISERLQTSRWRDWPSPLRDRARPPRRFGHASSTARSGSGSGALTCTSIIESGHVKLTTCAWRKSRRRPNARARASNASSPYFGSPASGCPACAACTRI